ncbi:MAG: hypothetical protein N2D54_12230 [Chloroflexota bacterium]
MAKKKNTPKRKKLTCSQLAMYILGIAIVLMMIFTAVAPAFAY